MKSVIFTLMLIIVLCFFGSMSSQSEEQVQIEELEPILTETYNFIPTEENIDNSVTEEFTEDFVEEEIIEEKPTEENIEDFIKEEFVEETTEEITEKTTEEITEEPTEESVDFFVEEPIEEIIKPIEESIEEATKPIEESTKEIVEKSTENIEEEPTEEIAEELIEEEEEEENTEKFTETPELILEEKNEIIVTEESTVFPFEEKQEEIFETFSPNEDIITPTFEPQYSPTPTSVFIPSVENSSTPEPTLTPTFTPKPEKKVIINTDRKNVVVEGEEICLASTLYGFENYEVHYQWEVDKNDGRGFQIIENSDTSTYSYYANYDNLTWNWRLTVFYDEE